jgi:uncharacterized protein (DUF2141 family)
LVTVVLLNPDFRLLLKEKNNKPMNTQHKIRLVLIGVFTAAATVFTYAQNMTVVIKNVKGNAGNIRLAIYNSDDQFMKKEIAAVEVKAVNGQVVAVLKNIGVGTYAISVIHDANNNKELDSNAFGMPKEGFGFSNDAMGMFGPPDFKKASFVYTNQEVVVNLKYM